MTTQPDLERLRSIKTLPQLIAYLRDVLDWPIEQSAVADTRFRGTSSSMRTRLTGRQVGDRADGFIGTRIRSVSTSGCCRFSKRCRARS